MICQTNKWQTELLTQVSGLQVQCSLSCLTIAPLYHTLTLQGIARGRGWGSGGGGSEAKLEHKLAHGRFF